MRRQRRRIETVQTGNAQLEICRRSRTPDGHLYPSFEINNYSCGPCMLRAFAGFEYPGNGDPSSAAGGA